MICETITKWDFSLHFQVKIIQMLWN